MVSVGSIAIWSRTEELESCHHGKFKAKHTIGLNQLKALIDNEMFC